MNIQQIRSDAERISKSGFVRTDGGIVLKSDYNAKFVESIKALPKKDRFWDAERQSNRFWFVADGSADAAIAMWEKFFGAAQPAQPKATVKAQPQRNTVKVRYCPDCGHSMEFDGVWYCEHCEG